MKAGSVSWHKKKMGKDDVDAHPAGKGCKIIFNKLGLHYFTDGLIKIILNLEAVDQKIKKQGM